MRSWYAHHAKWATFAALVVVYLAMWNLAAPVLDGLPEAVACTVFWVVLVPLTVLLPFVLVWGSRAGERRSRKRRSRPHED